MIKRGASLLLASGLVLATAAFAETPKKARTNSADRSQTTMSDDMRRAIEFQRAKDRADARQARLEARHPSVPAPSAERTADQSTVKDPGPAPRKDQ